MTNEEKIRQKVKLLADPLVLELLYDFNHHNDQVRDLLKHYEYLLGHISKPRSTKKWVQRDLEDQIKEEKTQNY